MEELKDQLHCRPALKRHFQAVVCMIVKGLSRELALAVDVLTVLLFVSAYIQWLKTFVELCTRSAVCLCLYHHEEYLWRV